MYNNVNFPLINFNIRAVFANKRVDLIDKCVTGKTFLGYS